MKSTRIFTILLALVLALCPVWTALADEILPKAAAQTAETVEPVGTQKDAEQAPPADEAGNDKTEATLEPDVPDDTDPGEEGENIPQEEPKPESDIPDDTDPGEEGEDIPQEEPTPSPDKLKVYAPASRAETFYIKDEADLTLEASEVITAFVVGCTPSLKDGDFAWIYDLVNANIASLLKTDPEIPADLMEYEEILSAVCADLVDGLTFNLSGKQINSKKSKSVSIFTDKDSVIGSGRLVKNDQNIYVVNPGTYTVKSVSKGTYYLQLIVAEGTAPRLTDCLGVEQLALCYPVKIAKMSTGSGGGGGGGGSSGSGTGQLPTARLIVDSVRTEPANPEAGQTFDIILSLRNTSEKLAMRNLQITYTTENGALVPVSGTNTEYIDRIDAGAFYEMRLNVRAKPDLEESSVALDVSAEFEDSKYNALSASQSLIIPVKQVQRIQLDDPKLPTTATVAGDSYEVEMGVFNMGKTMLYNVTVKAVPKDAEKVAAGQSYYIGNMEPGTSKTAELELIPLEGGTYDADIEVAYETVEGEKTSLTKSITFTAESEESYDYTDPFEDMTDIEPVEVEPPTVTEVMAMLPWQIYALAGFVVLILIVWIGTAVHRRRMRALEDDEMD